MIFNALMNTTSDSVYIKDTLGRLVLVNLRGLLDMGNGDPEQVIGWSDTELFGKEFGDRTRQQEEVLIQTVNAVDGVIEVRGYDPDNLYWSSTTKIPLKDPDGNIVGLIGITRNISDLKFREHQLKIMATHDPLTNIYNRTGLLEQLQEKINKADSLLAVLAIDLDNFKQINDHYHHKTGDEFLQWFAAFLKSNLRPNDIVSRYGGDEFIIVLDNIQTIQHTIQFCYQLYERFHDLLEPRFQALGVGMSMGASFYPLESRDPYRLIDIADEAMYTIKRNGKGRFYHPSMEDKLKDNDQPDQ